MFKKFKSSFQDYKLIKFKNGHGGNGLISFDKSLRKYPSGGNGGKGGSVIIQVDQDTQSFGELGEVYSVENGRRGQGDCMHGANGQPLIIKVPVGTIVREIRELIKKDDFIQNDTDALINHAIIDDAHIDEDASMQDAIDDDIVDDGIDEDTIGNDIVADALKEKRASAYVEEKMKILNEHFIFKKGYVPQQDRIKAWLERLPYKSKKVKPLIYHDLIKHGEEVVVRTGGKGGAGNPHFVTSSIQGPSICEQGGINPDLTLEFELKSIADVGLVGLPNAGKSTLLKSISNAQPKIAPYPFTTLNPYLGTITYRDHTSITVSDMPGIIAGAHLNRGLGMQFLRHIERVDVFVFVVDLTLNPLADLKVLMAELDGYGMKMRRSVVVANKADFGIICKANLTELEGCGYLVIPVSAKYSANVDVLLHELRMLVEQVRREKNK